MEFIAPMLILIVAFLVVGSIFRTHFVNKRLRENARAYADLQTRLIDKFGDADQVVRYLESDAGRQLLAGAESGRGGVHTRVLDSLQTGIITLLAGGGLLAAAGTTDRTVNDVMSALGMIAMMIGAGFIVSGVVSRYLIKSWGLNGKPGSAPRTDELE